MLEVEPTGLRGRVATKSGQNVLEDENFQYFDIKSTTKRKRALVISERE